MPLDTATRPRREISQESAPTRASSSSSQPQSPSPVSSSLRRSIRSTRGQSPNRLIQGSSDQIHLGKGPSRQTPAAHLVHIEEADPSHFYKSSSNLSSFPSCSIPTAFLVATQPGLTAIYDLNGITQSYAFKASKSDPDILSYDEAMVDVDRELWIEAAKKEIKSLEEHGTWTEVDASEATSRILPSQWVFKRKRTPDGNVKSHKGRTVARGDLEQGVFETYAPVVAWSTVRLFLILSLVLDWCTCSIDFSSAFVQAVLKKEVWLHIPRGFKSGCQGKTILRLNKSIYGLSVAPKLWYGHLFKALRAVGFVDSKLDPCLLFKKDMMLVVYVDDVVTSLLVTDLAGCSQLVYRAYFRQ
jgi:hypothetical protein